MNAIDTRQAAIFIGVFSIIAMLINSTQSFGRSRGESPATMAVPNPSQLEAQQAAQNAAAEHAKFLARYLNGSFTRQAGSQNVALVVVDENGISSPAVTTALVRRFQGASVQVSTSFFTSGFVSDGLFKDALAGSRDLFRKLDLAKSVDALVLARENVQYSQNPALENVTTATVELDVNVVPVSSQGENLSWTFTANGPGFSQDVARKAAEDRLIKQIAADTKMSLN